LVISDPRRLIKLLYVASSDRQNIPVTSSLHYPFKDLWALIALGQSLSVSRLQLAKYEGEYAEDLAVVS
ncbi:hypothetical protein ANCCAN_06733, partial [Ancylostoma caninum]